MGRGGARCAACVFGGIWRQASRTRSPDSGATIYTPESMHRVRMLDAHSFLDRTGCDPSERLPHRVWVIARHLRDVCGLLQSSRESQSERESVCVARTNKIYRIH